MLKVVNCPCMVFGVFLQHLLLDGLGVPASNRRSEVVQITAGLRNQREMSRPSVPGFLASYPRECLGQAAVIDRGPQTHHTTRV